MPSSPVSAMLAFSELQLAAEATRLDEVFAGTLTLDAALRFGNNRTSRFTDVDAAQFAAEWEVVAHKPNTGTGFSGTVFGRRAAVPSTSRPSTRSWHATPSRAAEAGG